MRGARDDVDKMFAFVQKNHPWLFCSELVCIVYRRLDILNNDINVQNYLPVDFVQPGAENEVYSIMQLPPIFLKQIEVVSATRFYFLKKIYNWFRNL
jgi:hypothetical protein